MMVDSKNKVHILINREFLTALSLKRQKSFPTAELLATSCIQNKFCQTFLSVDPHNDLTTVIVTVENTKQDPL